MIPVLVAFVGGLFALLPTLVTTRRRRLLHLLRDEAAVLEALKSDVAKDHLRDAMERTAFDYRQRALGLDKRDRARRRMWLAAPVTYVFVLVGLFIGSNAGEISDRLGVSEKPVKLAQWWIVGIAFAGLLYFCFAALRQTVLARRAFFARLAREDEERTHERISGVAGYEPAD